jgi:aspartyl protease family protein
MLAFWLLIMAGLYLVFDRLEQRQQARLLPQAGATGELVIPRGRDGHFRVPGRVNGQPVLFLVDTGASVVTVSESLARQAGLADGQPVTFQTANGRLQGRIVRQVPVAAGHLFLPGTEVAVGLVGLDNAHGLLGQSFLSRFNIDIAADQMVLRLRRAVRAAPVSGRPQQHHQGPGAAIGRPCLHKGHHFVFLDQPAQHAALEHRLATG